MGSSSGSTKTKTTITPTPEADTTTIVDEVENARKKRAMRQGILSTIGTSSQGDTSLFSTTNASSNVSSGKTLLGQ